jgi:uncharacterized protein (DUF2062 family)
MIFKRRERPSTYTRVREAVAPRKGIWRGVGYIHLRMRRLPDSPHRIALGFACGSMASFTPFFGLHFVIAAGLAWAARANLLAALFGTVVGNPLTFPLISAVSLWTGRRLLGLRDDVSDFEAVTHAFAHGLNSIWATVKSWFGHGPSMLDGLSVFMMDVFLPYLVGGILPGLVTSAGCYWVIGPLIAAYQERRRERLMSIQARQRAQLDEELAAYSAADGREGDNA